MYEARTYRSQINRERFSYFNVIHLESDLLVGLNGAFDIQDVQITACEAIKKLRSTLDRFIAAHPEFRTSLEPLNLKGGLPDTIKELLHAATIAGTGPMAGIAGLFSSFIAESIEKKYHPKEIIVENGGDIYARVKKPLSIAVYAGESILSGKLKIQVKPGEWGVCTSSGTVGHSLSFGNADAVTVLSKSPVIADALATGLGNLVKSAGDIDRILSYSEEFEQILGVVIVVGDRVGIRGNIELV